MFVVESKMATPIDWNVVDRNALSPVQLSFPNLDRLRGAIQLCFATARRNGLASNHPNSWADFWDVRSFPGGGRCGAPSHCR